MNWIGLVQTGVLEYHIETVKLTRSGHVRADVLQLQSRTVIPLPRIREPVHDTE